MLHKKNIFLVHDACCSTGLLTKDGLFCFTDWRNIRFLVEWGSQYCPGDPTRYIIVKMLMSAFIIEHSISHTNKKREQWMVRGQSCRQVSVYADEMETSSTMCGFKLPGAYGYELFCFYRLRFVYEWNQSDWFSYWINHHHLLNIMYMEFLILLNHRSLKIINHNAIFKWSYKTETYSQVLIA